MNPEQINQIINGVNELRRSYGEKLNEITNALNIHSKKINGFVNWINIRELQIDLLKSYSDSKSQYFQDLFVLKVLEYKKNGFFVEFGACDGLAGSNTFILEKKFGWNGILAEPSRVWWDSIKKNRNVNIDFRCVYSESNLTLDFSETSDAMLSTLTPHLKSDMHGETRINNPIESYPVTTISLNDLLAYYNAPLEIDYLSIDTEGTEYEILKNFDFKKYKVKIITVEHNYKKDVRTNLFILLSMNGYELCHFELTFGDDWYILK
jgi:FkbM family methyltransferase